MGNSIANPFESLYSQLAELTKLVKDNNKASATPAPVAKKKPVLDGYMNKKEAAKYLSVSERWIQERKDLGILAFYQFGGVIRYKAKDLDDLGVRNESKL